MVVRGGHGGKVVFVCRRSAKGGRVYLVGDFNRWNPTVHRMVKAKDGSFRARVDLPPGVHQYKYVVDGVWIHDSEADRQVRNTYGTLNSVVVVPI